MDWTAGHGLGPIAPHLPKNVKDTQPWVTAKTRQGYRPIAAGPRTKPYPAHLDATILLVVQLAFL